MLELYPENNALISDIVVAQELILKNHQSLRQMAHVLHSGILEHFGLPAALRKFGSDIEAPADAETVEVNLELSDNFPRLRPAAEIGIYRIVQEAVTNAMKHANAKTILIRLAHSGHSVEVIVRDDGRGFEINNLPAVGIGFASMRERADIIGARFAINSTPGAGTEITIELANDPEED